jgi:uncharacterized membrane-anchored protein YjiN (DUF445 family)
MAVVFVMSSFWRESWPALGFVWAFSEAALIGGLADWFAVTALFRRPLGLPIPHTAIVPNRKNEIGQALARFVAEHFLVREALQTELVRFDMARSFGRWLGQPGNARRLAADLAKAARWTLGGAEFGPLRGAVTSSLRDLGRSIPKDRLIVALVDVFISGPHAQDLVDALVAHGRTQLERNKHLIRDRIKERSPWWLPRFVDEEIYDQLVGELERILGEVGEDQDHPARAELRQRLEDFSASIETDTALSARSEELVTEFLNHPATKSLAADISQRAHDLVLAALDDHDSELRRGLEQTLQDLGRALEREPEVAARLNAWLADVIVYLVETYREPISSVIATTIARWDADATSRRIELHLGRDLQFIRINGTLVGGLVGLILYISWTAAAG